MGLQRMIDSLHGYMEREIYDTLGMYRNHAEGEYELRLDIVVVSVMLAALLRVALAPLFGWEEQFSLFILAVVASAWFAGFWAGLTAAVLSAVTGVYFITGDFRGMEMPATELMIRAGVFVVEGAIISFLITSITRARLRTTQVTRELVKEREDLGAANRKIKNILESISDGFAAIDKEGRLAYANKKIESFLGMKREAVIGKAVWEVFASSDFAKYFELYKEAKRTKKAQTFEYYSIKLRTWFLVSVYPAKDGVSFYLTDITERKNREQRKDEFVSVASHELKTPVTSVKLFAEILRKRFEETGDKASAGYINKIYEQLEKLTKLIRTLLDVSALQEGKMRFEREPFELCALLRDVCHDLEVVSSGHRIELQATDDIVIVGDKDRLRQVLSNLIINGIKYSPNADRVVVSLTKGKENALIKVQDFGIGIPEGQKGKIFDRYFQGNAEGSDAHAYQGLGLGLYIVHEIVSRHKGKIWVESAPDKGSVFFVSLPLA